jgi:hypothetical protein
LQVLIIKIISVVIMATVHSAATSHPVEIGAWEKEVAGDHFHKDLQLNLRDFDSSVIAGRDVDREFIAILGRDLTLLRAHYQSHASDLNSHRLSELPEMDTTLKKISSQLGKVRDGSVTGGKKGATVSADSPEDVHTPLVGAIGSPLDLRTGDKSPMAQRINAGLTLLEKDGFRVRRVRGNGHCLFSSVASQLLTVERLTALKAKVPALIAQGMIPPQNPDPMQMIDWWIEHVRAGDSVEKLFQDERVYNDWVLFLRRISTGYWRNLIKDDRTKDKAVTALAPTAKHAMPTLRKLSNLQACMQYLERMSTLSSAGVVEYGGPAEIEGLDHILGIRIKVADAVLLDDGKYWGEMFRIMDPNDMWLLYQNNHYNALYSPKL